jgi:hypothetical protein
MKVTAHGVRAAAQPSEAMTLHDRWTLFPGLWCWALLMHQATFDKWQYSPIGWALCACAVALVLKPRSVPILAATVAVNAVYSIQCLPETANHLLFEGFVCFAWVLAFALHAAARLRTGVPLRRVLAREPGEPHPLEASRTPLGIGLLLVYWLSVLHKLNYDFVDPETSCASYMYRRVSETLPFLPKAIWAEHVAIWSTLLAEASVPVLLLSRRTWQLGLVAALAFHLLLGFDPTPGIYSFTGLLYALFILVLPETFVATAAGCFSELTQRLGRRTLDAVRFSALAVAIGILAYGTTREDQWSFRAGFVFFLVWALVVAVGYLLSLKRTLEQEGTAEPASAGATSGFAHALLWILPLVTLLNGLNPYLGLRTQLSFSMFSNLRTEGGQSNHLFMPRLLNLGGFQEDLVEILETNDAELERLHEHQLLLPYFEFRRAVSGSENVRVRYLRNGEQRTFECVDGACNDRELAEPYSRLMSRLLYFRPIDKGPHMMCRH